MLTIHRDVRREEQSHTIPAAPHPVTGSSPRMTDDLD